MPQIQSPADWVKMPRYGRDFFDGQLEAVKGLVQAVGHEAAIVRFRDPFGSPVGMGKSSESDWQSKSPAFLLTSCV
jgi:hypothetical protein